MDDCVGHKAPSHNFALLFSQRSEPKFGLFRHFAACPALLHITVGGALDGALTRAPDKPVV
jgi:hypothetical protein